MASVTAQRIEQAKKELDKKSILYTSNNNGVHLIIESPIGLIDFYPATRRWKERNGISGIGLGSLIYRVEDLRKGR